MSDALEEQRRIWRRVRQQLGLASVDDDRFALRGSPPVAESIAGRLLILPRDPSGTAIEFDEDFWEFFPNPCPDPVTGGRTDFGDAKRSLANCAVLYEQDWADSAAPWRSYLALYRSGALDLTFPASFARGDAPRVFHEIGIVAWTWSAFARYSRIVETYEIAGPFEVTLALRNTQGAAIGGFGEGWLDPFRDPFRTEGLPRCIEPHVLLRLELDPWPDGVESEEAFRLGGWIENAWGQSSRRFLARLGEFAGQFDPRPYR